MQFIKNNNFLFIFLSTIIFLFFITVGGGPITNDEIKFILFLNNNELPNDFLGRFTHIYILKIFSFLIKDPIQLLIIVWTLIISITNFLVMKISFVLTKKSFIASIIASVLFVFQPIVARKIGALYSDNILMLFFVLSIYIYIQYLEKFPHNHNNTFYIILLFIIFYFGIRVKPTGIVLVIPLILIFIENYKIKKISELLVGFIYSVLIFFITTILLDFLITNNPFQSFELNGLVQTLENNLNNKSVHSEKISWLGLIFSNSFSFLFMNFIIFIYTFNSNKNIKILPIFVLSSLIFLTLIIFFSPRVIERHLYPLLPIFCIISSLIINRTLYSLKLNHLLIILNKNYYLFIIILIGIVILVLSFVFKNISNMITLNSWRIIDLILYIYFPLLIIALLTKSLFSEKLYSLLYTLIFILYLLPLLVSFPNNVSFAKNSFKKRVEPINFFLDNFDLKNNENILISRDFAFGEFSAGRESLMKLIINNNSININNYDTDTEFISNIDSFKYFILSKQEYKNFKYDLSNFKRLQKGNFFYFSRL